MKVASVSIPDQSTAENTENLIANIDAWLNSYSCIGLFGEYGTTLREAVSSLNELKRIAENPKHQTAPLEFVLSSETKDYYAAMASCYLDDQRLAEIDDPVKIDYLESLLPPNEKYWVVGSHKCTTREKGSVENDEDCNEKFKFVCASGAG